MSYLITLGHFTRKHGPALSYDVSSADGLYGFLRRLGDLSAVDLRRLLADLDTAPAYVRASYRVKQFAKEIANELRVRGEL